MANESSNRTTKPTKLLSLTTKTGKLLTPSMSSISSCCTQDECGDCKGHNVSQSNPEEQIQDYQKRLGTWVALELDILPILLSFLHILNCIFDACKAGTGPINVTLDMFSVSLRTGPHSQSHGQYWIYLGMQKEEHGAMLRPGTV